MAKKPTKVKPKQNGKDKPTTSKWDQVIKNLNARAGDARLSMVM